MRVIKQRKLLKFWKSFMKIKVLYKTVLDTMKTHSQYKLTTFSFLTGYELVIRIDGGSPVPNDWYRSSSLLMILFLAEIFCGCLLVVFSHGFELRLDVEANISVEEQMTQITTTKNVETDLGHG
ncbi:hypothetical protein DY000_02008630 [Brassica cretica]|uniref:Uncharacterized protein n=1 Tax=Brassica cretica TaxID=69181 RepID=A0ABQ7CCI3_BRACR|nr:hypothetical protein DY000_02008630 [Brassica cretica]